MLAIITFGSKYEDYGFDELGWSFALATLAALLFLANGALMIFMALKNGFSMSRRPIPCVEKAG